MTDDALTEAIVVWTGYGESAWPRRDDQRLSEHVVDAERLIPLVHVAEADCWASGAHLMSGTLSELARAAELHLRAHRPELGDQAVAALVWAYTFDNK